MGNFFNSEIIQEELMEINELQTHVYQNALSFEKMEREDQLEHIDELVELLEKQRVMFTRLSLSDDPAAKKMKKEVEEGARKMGLPSNVDLNILFANMNNMVEMMKNEIDKESTT